MNITLETKDHATSYCKRCHRKLTDLKSIELGYGRLCYKKYIEDSQAKMYLFDI